MPTSSRYYSTPIGAGMSNLANAIGAVPGLRAQEGLLAQRQTLLDQQAMTEAAQAANYAAQARHRDAQTEGVNITNQGLRGLAEAFMADPQGTIAQVTAQQAPAPTMPGMTVPGVESAPVSMGPPGGVAGALTGPTSMPTPAPTAPSPTLGGGTRVTPELVRKIAGYGAMSGQKPEDALLMFGAGNVASQQTAPDDAVSYLQSGSGKAYGSTIRGGKETIGQRAAAADKASADRRYATDTTARTSITNTNTRVNAPKTPKGGGKDPKAPKLAIGERKAIENAITDAASEAGLTIGTQQRELVLAKIAERYANGEPLEQVSVEELEGMVEQVPAVETAWFDGKKDQPASTKFRAPKLEGRKAPAAAAAPASAPGKAISKLPPDAKFLGTSGGKKVYELPGGKRIVEG